MGYTDVVLTLGSFIMDNETQTPTQLLRSVGGGHVRSVLIAVLVLLAAFLAVQTINSVKEFRYIGTSPTYNAITVNGEGEVLAVPDIASFTFSVIEEAPSAADAQNAAAEKIRGIVAFIKESGVEEKDIKTVSFNLYPRYEFRRGSIDAAIEFYPPGGERQLVGFEISQAVEVKVRDTAKAGQIIAAVSELGAGSVSGLSFTVDDEEALKAEARSKAIADAKTKASVLASELEVRLVRVISYGESEGPYYGARFDTGGGLGGSPVAISESVEAVIPSGENRYVSNVSVTYEIR